MRCRMTSSCDMHACFSIASRRGNHATSQQLEDGRTPLVVRDECRGQSTRSRALFLGYCNTFLMGSWHRLVSWSMFNISVLLI